MQRCNWKSSLRTRKFGKWKKNFRREKLISGKKLGIISNESRRHLKLSAIVADWKSKIKNTIIQYLRNG